MRRVVLSALAGLAALTAVAAAPQDAKADVAVGIGFGVMPVQWGGPPPPPHWDRPDWRRPPPPPPPPHWDRPHWRRPPPPPPPPYGIYRPARPHYGPTCWRERRWVDTPWGPERRWVRICR